MPSRSPQGGLAAQSTREADISGGVPTIPRQCFAAAQKLAREGRLTADDEVVICITGNGLKTTDAVAGSLPEAPIVDAKVREVAALVAARG